MEAAAERIGLALTAPQAYLADVALRSRIRSRSVIFGSGLQLTGCLDELHAIRIEPPDRYQERACARRGGNRCDRMFARLRARALFLSSKHSSVDWRLYARTGFSIRDRRFGECSESSGERLSAFNGNPGILLLDFRGFQCRRSKKIGLRLCAATEHFRSIREPSSINACG